MVDRPAESKHRFLPVTHLVEHVNAADHGRLVEVREVGYSPWLTAHLGTNLNEDLVADGADILAAGDRITQHYLGRDRQVFEEKALQVIVEGGLAFGSGEDEDDSLDRGIEVRLECVLPFWESIRSDSEFSGLLDFVSELFATLLHGLDELHGGTLVLLTVEDAPLLEHRLLVHGLLDAAVDVWTIVQLELNAFAFWTLLSHNHVAGGVLPASALSWFVID
jgi:hypothetical protein